MSARTHTSRTLSSREAELHPQAWVSPSMIPMPNPREGVRYKWVRMVSSGTTDKSQMHRARVQGFIITNPADVPELSHLLDRGTPSDMVEFGGLVLMHASSHIVAQRNKQYIDMHAAQDRAVNTQLQREANHKMPITNNSASSGFGLASSNHQ